MDDMLCELAWHLSGCSSAGPKDFLLAFARQLGKEK